VIVPVEERDETNTIQAHFSGGFSIPDVAPASIYPATVNVSGISGVVSKIRVTINGLAHFCFQDLDVLLVGPTGQSVVLMSDAGSCGFTPSAIDLTFDDFAWESLDSFQPPLPGGSYRPTNYGAGDSFPAPAPTPSGATRLSAFNGTSANGAWKLFIVDDAFGYSGSVGDGWTLDIVTMKTFCDPRAATIPASGNASIYPYEFDVSLLPPQLSKVSVTIHGLSHENPDDLFVELEHPGGTRIPLMQAVGGSADVNDLTLIFDDEGVTYLPDDGPIGWSGTYRPALIGATLESLRGYNPNGVWKLWIQDVAAGNAGGVARGACLNITTILPADSCQMFPITIPSGAPASTSGPASPYPSTMHVAGTAGLTWRAEVKLLGLTHTYPDDLELMLETPSGTKFQLMSDAGGSTDVSNLDLRFDQAPLIPIVPDETPLGPGPYWPWDYEPGDELPPPGPPGPYVAAIHGEAPNGDWKLWVADDAGADVGSIAGWCLNLHVSEPYRWACAQGGQALTIPAGAPGTSSGPAGPYPATAFAGQDGTVVAKVTAYLVQFAHTYPDDLDILLVGPRGQKVMLMSDAGGSDDASLPVLLFDDEAAEVVPDSAPLTGTFYRPANYDGGDGDSLPAPAPPGPYDTHLGAFNGTDPRGTWNLYVFDDAGQDVGSALAWCVKIDPMFPAGEPANLRWTDKTTLAWDGAPNSQYYAILRGTQGQIGGLVDGSPDSCVAKMEIGLTAGGFDLVPNPGTYFWYLVAGTNLATPGTSGSMRIGGVQTARTADFVGYCPLP
jgi:subtilisin-like proprotein convertase family protein